MSRAPSISAAARSLRQPQPLISQQLARLEQELRVPLVVRGPQGITLTEAGEIFAQTAQDVLARMEQAQRELRETHREASGLVKIAMTPAAAQAVLVPLTAAVRQTLSLVRLNTFEAFNLHAQTWVQDGTVDLAIVYEPDPNLELVSQVLLHEELYLISSPEAWPFDSPPGSDVRYDALLDLDLILPSRSQRRTIERYQAALNKPLRITMEVDSMTQINELVAQGAGYTIFTPVAVRNLHQSGKLVRGRIIEPNILRPVYLVYRKGQLKRRAVRAVADLVRSLTAEQVLRGEWEGHLPAP